MKTKTAIAVLAALTLFGLSCEPLESDLGEAGGRGRVVVKINAASAPQTKSTAGFSETEVTNLNIYAYRGDQLAAESYSEGAALQMELNSGVEYTFYALANCGEVHAPASRSSLASISVAPSQMAMCLREGVNHTFSAGSHSLSIQLTRLFARFELVLDKELENCDYQVNSVRIKQQAASISPFTVSKASGSTEDGDCASPADLAALNNGQGAVFYVPENCQGVLLPHNDDPWEKTLPGVPEQYRNLCTYLHIEGEWTTSGASADLDLKIMLGSDSCKDFSIVRNTSVTITLTLSDSGTIKANWKSSLGDLDDQRVLSFVRPTQTVMQEGGWTQVPVTVSPADMAFYPSFSDSDNPILEAKVEGGRVYVRALYDGDERPHTTLTVTSWDGRHSSSTDITLDYAYTGIPGMDWDFPEYCGQYGWLSFPSASAERPLTVSVAGWSVTLGPDRPGLSDLETYNDLGLGLQYFVVHSLKKMYVRALKKDAQMNFEVSQYKSKTNPFMHSVGLPGLNVSDGIVSEAGNRKYDAESSFSYDDDLSVWLSDASGNKLDLETFAVPEPILPYKGLTNSVSDRMSEFQSFYGLIHVESPSMYGYRATDITTGTMCEEDDIARVLVYGTADYGRSTPTFPVRVSMNLASGDSIVAEGALTGIQAFPSQRYLGVYYNYQIAPPPLRSNSIEIDFTSGGSCHSPSPNGVTWQVVHADGSDYGIPDMAVSSGEADDYSEGASLAGFTMNFAPLHYDLFPACGVLGLTGRVTNPHTGKTYSGVYTLDVILYVSVGCQIDYMPERRIGISFVPFCEGAIPENSVIWSDFFPSNVLVNSSLNHLTYHVSIPTEASDNPIKVVGFDTPLTLEDAAASLRSHLNFFSFSFSVGGTQYDELLLDRSFVASSDGPGSFDYNGGRGYYHLVRQYDLGSFDHGTKYYGLENYIIEAAYESLYSY